MRGLVVLAGWMALSAAVWAAEAPRMEKDELKARLGGADTIVIDVRAYTDWLLSRGKIRGAVREDYRDFEDWRAKYPTDKTLVLYCA
jgi:rhodanese-related sulfurtransferase